MSPNKNGPPFGGPFVVERGLITEPARALGPAQERVQVPALEPALEPVLAQAQAQAQARVQAPGPGPGLGLGLGQA